MNVISTIRILSLVLLTLLMLLRITASYFVDVISVVNAAVFAVTAIPVDVAAAADVDAHALAAIHETLLLLPRASNSSHTRARSRSSNRNSNSNSNNSSSKNISNNISNNSTARRSATTSATRQQQQ